MSVKLQDGVHYTRTLVTLHQVDLVQEGKVVSSTTLTSKRAAQQVRAQMQHKLEAAQLEQVTQE